MRAYERHVRARGWRRIPFLDATSARLTVLLIAALAAFLVRDNPLFAQSWLGLCGAASVLLSLFGGAITAVIFVVCTRIWAARSIQGRTLARDLAAKTKELSARQVVFIAAAASITEEIFFSWCARSDVRRNRRGARIRRDSSSLWNRLGPPRGHLRRGARRRFHGKWKSRRSTSRAPSPLTRSPYFPRAKHRPNGCASDRAANDSADFWARCARSRKIDCADLACHAPAHARSALRRVQIETGTCAHYD